ncbi:attacin-A-like [Drosophila guanche]|uniref:Blast:Attacin-A n=1 Tax=Drosophila guanche TaxID=7266 RepID=A0A3B0KVR6_DROGU|nr:attacin-A-like [Drosophila guanche]XP_034137398.1 attacin-A-like [Drosophila guanche]SPP88098.1 blast:Attacin-A [Drosophila guanche]SPP88099.1 blast:Attacin-A [Drosophila guanche]
MQKGIILIVALVALGAIAEAMPQRFGPFPQSPPPKPLFRHRFRRQVLGGSLASNPAGGADARMDLTKAIGTPDHNAVVQAFAAGNTKSGPATVGGTAAYNNNGHGASVTRTHTPGVKDSFQQEVHANLFNDGVHNLDAKAFASQNKLANGFEFQRNGAALDYSHINGHGASVTHSNFPGIGRQLGAEARANLWSSADRNTNIDLTGTASKWMSGPFSNQRTDFGAGLGLTHRFGG